MNRVFLYFIILSWLVSNSLLAQQDKHDEEQLFNNAYKKYENKDFTGSYIDYSSYLAKNQMTLLPYTIEVCALMS